MSLPTTKALVMRTHLLCPLLCSLLLAGCQGSLDSNQDPSGQNSSTSQTSTPKNTTSTSSNVKNSGTNVASSSTTMTGNTTGGVDTGGGGTTTAPPKMELPADQGVRRLTVEQYKNVLYDTSVMLNPRLATSSVYNNRLSQRHQNISASDAMKDRTDGLAPFTTYMRMALFTADNVVGQDRDLTRELSREAEDETKSRARLEQWLKEKGHLFFRRPMTEEEIAYYRDEVARHPLNQAKMIEVVATLMLSPYFLLRIEGGEDPTKEERFVPLNSYELASRLAFFLWQAPPDQELYLAAADQSLLNDDVLTAQFTRMIEDPRSDAFFKRLGTSWLGLHDGDLNFAVTSRSAQILNEYDGALKRFVTDFNGEGEIGDILKVIEPMIMNDLANFLRHTIVSQEGTIQDVFTSSAMTATDKEVSKLYGVEEPWDGTGTPPTHDAARGGLLGRVAFLATPAPRTRPIIRGLRVRLNVLCGFMSPAPDDIEFKSPPNPPYSTRELVDHSTGPQEAGCWGCHQSTNGLGFSFSGYDIFGQSRTQEDYYFSDDQLKNLPNAMDLKTQVDDKNRALALEFERITGKSFSKAREDRDIRGSWPNALSVDLDLEATPRIELGDDSTTVKTPLELAQLLAPREDVARCFVKHLGGITLDGAHFQPQDQQNIEEMLKSQSMIEAMKALVLSDSFRTKAFGHPIDKENAP